MMSGNNSYHYPNLTLPMGISTHQQLCHFTRCLRNEGKAAHAVLMNEIGWKGKKGIGRIG
jgi:hypothetical protein